MWTRTDELTRRREIERRRAKAFPGQVDSQVEALTDAFIGEASDQDPRVGTLAILIGHFAARITRALSHDLDPAFMLCAGMLSFVEPERLRGTSLERYARTIAAFQQARNGIGVDDANVRLGAEILIAADYFSSSVYPATRDASRSPLDVLDEMRDDPKRYNRQIVLALARDLTTRTEEVRLRFLRVRAVHHRRRRKNAR